VASTNGSNCKRSEERDFCNFEQVVADGKDDGLECGGTSAIPSDVALIEKLEKSEANEFPEQCELVRVVSIER